MRYRDWLNEWLENEISHTAKPKTIESYQAIIEQRLIPRFGEWEMDEITPLDVQRYISELSKEGNLITNKGLSANTIKIIIAIIQGSLQSAYRLGVLREYTMHRLKRPKTKEKSIFCFSQQEQKIIEKAVLGDKRDKMIGILLCLYTGIRIGELLALEWGDIDFKNAELTVNKTCHDGKGVDGEYCRVINAPKTQTSKRTIPVPRQLLPVLRAKQRKSVCKYCIADGEKPPSVRAYQRSFELLLKKLNLPHRGFHALRHTFATRAIECGIDVKTLSEILGHKNSSITLNCYAHSLMDHKHSMVNKLGKMFGG